MRNPVKPTQISLISGFNIGLPGFLLAMENNTKRQHGRLLYRTLKGATPAALIGFLSVAILMIAGPAAGLTEDEVSVTGMYMLTAIGFALLWKLIQPLNKYRIGVFLICIIGMVFMITVFWDMFIHAEVSAGAGWAAVGLAAAVMAVAWCVMTVIEKAERRKEAAGEAG